MHYKIMFFERKYSIFFNSQKKHDSIGLVYFFFSKIIIQTLAVGELMINVWLFISNQLILVRLSIVEPRGRGGEAWECAMQVYENLYL